MAINAEQAIVPMTAGERVKGLSHIANLRTKVFGESCGDELKRFMFDMRDKRDVYFEKNKRALAAIFFLANLKSERHECDFDELTSDEKYALIGAMNHFRAVVSLFPKKLSLPN
ncbi:DUF5347 family protein [Erwinia billingiae]|jgi:hypothetical protein|uniref:DUF5347 family protein n=1 Tax=Erwinia billingiae TaxID=182337 RepID=UPI00069FECED|nr:DUF5347 family protein [Erwinia billingiae]QEW33244.1 hypothetical protein D0N50_16865 [Erwinia billingiae]